MVGRWWPLRPLSRGQERVRYVVVERGTGGRVYAEGWAVIPERFSEAAS